jgi:hypothetical protein
MAAVVSSYGFEQKQQLVTALRERTALMYMGDCKCGRCQLVPHAMIDEACEALERLEGALREIIAIYQRRDDEWHNKPIDMFLVAQKALSRDAQRNE